MKFKTLYESSNLGDCFESNAKYALDHPDVLLCHGIPTGQEGSEIEGVRFSHAWTEKGNEVTDVSNGRHITLPKQIYYLLGKINPKEVVKYDYQKLIRKLDKNSHWGPWDLKGEYR